MQELLAPSDAPISSDCVFEIQESPDFISSPVNTAVQKLQLEFFSPTTFTYNQPAISIPIMVSSSAITNPVGYFTLNITCPQYTEEFQLDINQYTYFVVPENVTGICYFNASGPLYLSAETSVTINSVISLENVPATVYVNQNFTITIAATGTSDIVCSLQLNCNVNQLVAFWPDQPVNELLTLLLPITALPSNNCFFSTVPASFQIPAVPVPVTVSNVPLEFSQPTQDSFTQNDLIPIEVIAVGFPSLIQDVNVTWSCTEANYTTTILMTTYENQTFWVPKEAYGVCFLSINPAPLGFDSPPVVNFTIYWQLRLPYYPSPIYPTQYFPALVETIPPTGLATSTSLTLACDSLVVQTWFNIPFDEVVPLLLDSTVPAPSSNCFLQTNTNEMYVLEATTPISVQQIPMVIDSPQNGSTLAVPNPIEFFVSTPLNTSIYFVGGAQLTCGSNSKPISYTTNQMIENGYSDDFSGPCSIVIIDAPSYFAVPDILYFFIKYQLKILYAYESITIGKSFEIEIISSGKVPPNLEYIDVNLECSGKIVQRWSSVPLNEKTSLTVDVRIKPSTCYLVTAAPNDYFIQASYPVILGDSPFGGDIIYVPPEQQTQFAKSISAPLLNGWVELTFAN